MISPRPIHPTISTEARCVQWTDLFSQRAISPAPTQTPFLVTMVLAPLARRAITILLSFTLTALPAFAEAQQPTPPLDPNVSPISIPAPEAPQPNPSTTAAETARPATRIAPQSLGFSAFGLIGPYRSPRIPELFPGAGARLSALVRDGKLYLSAHDAIALALENNPDVEVSRFNLALADTDTRRAEGGGSLRGIDFTVNEAPNGVGGPGSPLLNNTANSPNPTVPAVTDLTALNSTNPSVNNLSMNAAGLVPDTQANVPLFDPQFILSTGYLRRSNTVSLIGTGTDTTGTGTSGGGNGSGGPTQTGTLNYISANVAYLQGFSPGTQIAATVNNDSQVIYSTKSEYDPFYAPSTSVTVTQPLLRGRGRAVNLRYLRIANLNRKISRLLFEQQVLDTIYGTERLYYDLVSLGENVQVQQEALRAALKLREDDADQVIQGTLAPIELTRVSALATTAEFALVQAQGLYRQQEVILRNQLIRTGSPVFATSFTEIVPTDRIVVPPVADTYNLPDLIQGGLARRPDIAQAGIQVQTNQITANTARNQVLPQLNLYANAETRGSSEVSFEPLGSPGTGTPSIPQNLALGGLRTSTIFQGGIQLTLPVRNRLATSDAARDAIQLRESQARTTKLAQQVREEIENGVIAVQTAFAAYTAASKSRDLQSQLLDAERDKLSAGQSTQLLVIQNESFLAQASSTEIAARSNYQKAQISLDHALGTLLEKNNIQLDDAIQGAVQP